MEVLKEEEISTIDIAEKYGLIHSIETCGTVDGPGIRYVIFLQGCPMRCKYCHNPDTWDTKGKTAIKMSVREVIEDIKKYISYMKFSGGGVTISGGEPLMQHDFVYELFKKCKEIGIDTALDTSGCLNLNAYENIFKYTDLILLDIKSINPDTFKKITEKEITNTLAFAEYASDKNIPMWIRFVLVPKLSDNKEEINQLAEYIKSLKSVAIVEVLPFHKMGEYKWEELGFRYELSETKEPTKEEVEEVKGIFSSYGLEVR